MWIDWRTAMGALVIGLALFLIGCFGAGDVKYFWACMLVVPNQIEELLITTSLAGLVLAIVYLAKHRFRPKEVDTIPYGVAISTGLALCLCRIFI
jgi:Flp pilus assembly protein protease CpaA